MKKKTENVTRIDALNIVIKTLAPLTAEDQKKVLHAAGIFFAVPVSKETSGADDLDNASGQTTISKLGGIIKKNDSLRPGQKAAVVAFCYMKQNKLEQFRLDDIRKVYTDIGLTPPDRMDMTIKAAVEGGKKLFKSMGHNAYGLTYHGQELGKKYAA